MELGFCPQCGAMIVEIGKKDYAGHWTYDKAKRKQALRLFNDNKEFITDSLTTTRIKHGNKSNMGFRYGKNVAVKNCKGEYAEIRRYAVDFNGTAELIK